MTAPQKRMSLPLAVGENRRRIQILEAEWNIALNKATYAIKLTQDLNSSPDSVPAQIVSGAFYVGIPPELDGWYVVKFWGYQTTPGSLGTDTQLRLTRTDPVTPSGSVTVTSTRVRIPDDGYYPSVQAVINPANNQVTAETNFLRVDIFDVDGAYGVSCEITLSSSPVLL